jgi:hypothetical protein
MKLNSEKQQQGKSRSTEAAINGLHQASIDRDYKEICRLRKEIESLAKDDAGRLS